MLDFGDLSLVLMLKLPDVGTHRESDGSFIFGILIGDAVFPFFDK